MNLLYFHSTSYDLSSGEIQHTAESTYN